MRHWRCGWAQEFETVDVPQAFQPVNREYGVACLAAAADVRVCVFPGTEGYFVALLAAEAGIRKIITPVYRKHGMICLAATADLRAGLEVTHGTDCTACFPDAASC